MEASNFSTISFSIEELKDYLLTMAGIKRKPKPSSHDWQAAIQAAFQDTDVMPRDALILKLKVLLSCGVNKITEAGGYLHQSADAGFVKKVGRSDYKFIGERTESEQKKTLTPPSYEVEPIVKETRIAGFKLTLCEPLELNIKNING